jgi:hypothetical protein
MKWLSWGPAGLDVPQHHNTNLDQAVMEIRPNVMHTAHHK